MPNLIKYHERPLYELTSEDAHQIALISWCNEPQTLQHYPQLRWLFSVPNGGQRSLKTASLMKKTGVKKGVFDLALMVPNSRYHGLFIEMKYGKNRLSAEQVEFQRYHESQGYQCAVCYSWLDAETVIKDYLSYL